MKKFWKALLIIVLVVASIAGTVYVFYLNFTRRRDSFAYISEYMASSQVEEFDAKLTKAKNYAGTRATILIDTNSELQDIVEILNGSMIRAKDFKINENAIIAKFDEVISLKANAEYELDQYIWKCVENDNAGQQFDKDLAFNDCYKAVSLYLAKMSEFNRVLNDNVQRIVKNPSADIKYAIIEIYSYACNNTFRNFNEEKYVGVLNSANMTWLNSNINFENGYLVTTNTEGNFTENNNKFMTEYTQSDRVKFAINIESNMRTINTINNSSTKEAKATYYLKQILGI